MKKLFSYLILALFVSVLSSCNKLPSMNKLTGTYNGGVDVEFNGADIAKSLPATTTLTIPMEEEDKVMLQVKVQALDILPVSEFNVVCNQFKSQDKDEYVLNGSTEIEIPEMGTIPFSVTGELDKKELSFTITALTSDLTIEVDFEGRK